MPKSLNLFIVFAFLGLMALPFTNCGNYADPANESVLDAFSEECDEDCIMPKSENLQLKVNLSQSGQVDVPPDLIDFNLGGDCNEGGYPYNVIRWELYSNGTRVRESGMTGMVGGGAAAHSVCVNGRFLIYINLNAIAQDPVNRTGLNTGAGRGPYDLYVEIFGSETPNGVAMIRNSVKGRHRVSLVPTP